MTLGRKCDTAWEEMDGGARVRYCHTCKHNVYDLEGLDEDAAKAFVARMEGLTDVNLSIRHDGRAITMEAARRRQFGWLRATVSWASAFLVGGLLVTAVPPPNMPSQSSAPTIVRHREFHRTVRHHPHAAPAVQAHPTIAPNAVGATVNTESVEDQIMSALPISAI